MRFLRVALFVFAVLALFGPTSVGYAGDVYDDSGVLRPEFGDVQMMEKNLRDSPQLTPTPPDAYGLLAYSAYNLSAGDFRPRLGSSLNFSGTDYYVYTVVGENHFFDASFHVPTGALVVGLTYWFYDNDADENFWYWLYDTHAVVGSASDTEIQTFQSSGQPGYSALYVAFDTPITARNYDEVAGGAHFYNMLIRLGSGNAGSSVRFGGFNIWYQLQIAPAPGTATFSDVPVGSFGFRHVEALARSGITAGCGGSNFCPNNTLTRVEMAVFLAKALGLHYPDDQ